MGGLREMLARRGLADSMMVGICGDRRPGKDAVEDLKAVAPWARWVVSSHSSPAAIGSQPVGYCTHVWGLHPAPDPSEARYYGWRNPLREAVFPRYGSSVIGHSLQVTSPLGAYRIAAEAALTARGHGAGLRGVGRCGADFWYVLTSERERKPLCGRYPETNSWHGGWLHNSFAYILAPGERGPIATARFEVMREGIQEGEARIFIEKALLDPARRAKLGDQLAIRCQAVLDERTRANRNALVHGAPGVGGGSHISWSWFAGSGWKERSEKLYAGAAQVAQNLNP